MLKLLYSLSLLILSSLSLSNERIDVDLNNASNINVPFNLDTPPEDEHDLDIKAKPPLFYLGLQTLPKTNEKSVSTQSNSLPLNYILSFKQQRAPPLHS